MTRRLSYFPELDGLRGIAVVLVFFSHAGVRPFLEGGGAGVAIFFALSGFLITAILIQEKEDWGGINLLYFYRRRFLRLVPALLVVSVPVSIVGMVTDYQLLAVLLYFGNVLRLDGNTLGWLHHTWSLAIEEQYYLIWPLLFSIYTPDRRGKYVAVMVFSFLALACWRGMLWQQSESILRVHFGTDTNFPELLAGCIAAIVWKNSEGRNGSVTAVYICMASLLVLAGGLRVLPGGDHYWIYSQQCTFGYSWPVIGAVTAVLIVQMLNSRDTVLHRLLRCRPLSYVGKISYGMYLYHLPIFYTVRAYFPAFNQFVYLFPLVVLISSLSYHWIESWFINCKPRNQSV